MRMLQFRRRNHFAERQLDLLQIKLPSWTANIIDIRQDFSVGWLVLDRTKQPERVTARPSMHRTRSEEVMSVVGFPEVEASVRVCVYVCVCVVWMEPGGYPRSYGTPPPTHTHTHKLLKYTIERKKKSPRKLLTIAMMYEVPL